MTNEEEEKAREIAHKVRNQALGKYESAYQGAIEAMKYKNEQNEKLKKYNLVMSENKNKNQELAEIIANKYADQVEMFVNANPISNKAKPIFKHCFDAANDAFTYRDCQIYAWLMNTLVPEGTYKLGDAEDLVRFNEKKQELIEKALYEIRNTKIKK